MAVSHIGVHRRSLIAVSLALSLMWVGALAPAAQTLDEVQQRTGKYVGTFLAGLANLVAQEDFTFRKEAPVKSEFLLVRYPGTTSDLITFRDVMFVNGEAQPNRDENLVRLFQSSFDLASARARLIMAQGSAHVPTALNPLFAIAFLQDHYRSRFRVELKGAGIGWPRSVRTLTFVETEKPTILRAGLLRELNVPTRGTVWVDVETGRVLQTELQIRDPKAITKLTTRFGEDARLGMMVPTEMRTENPDGRAVYSNYRRFNINVNEALQVPKP
jgi:hypothetical protein